MEFFKSAIIPGEVFVQLIAFVIVFWTLKLLAWKPILKAVQERREKIKNDFDRIEEARKEIEKLKLEYAAHLRKIDDEARSKILEAVEEGRRIARDIQEKARAESQETFEKTKENLNLEAAKARIQLRREIAHLTVQVTEKLIREQMNEAKQHEKIFAMIEELESSFEKKGGA